MKEIESELSTPPEIIKTWAILAPKGTSLEKKVVAINIAVELYSAQRERSIARNPTQKFK